MLFAKIAFLGSRMLPPLWKGYLRNFENAGLWMGSWVGRVEDLGKRIHGVRVIKTSGAHQTSRTTEGEKNHCSLNFFLRERWKSSRREWRHWPVVLGKVFCLGCVLRASGMLAPLWAMRPA